MPVHIGPVTLTNAHDDSATYSMVRWDKKLNMPLVIDKMGKLWWMNDKTNSFDEASPEDYKLKWDCPGLTKKRALELRQRMVRH